MVSNLIIHVAFADLSLPERFPVLLELRKSG
jgi:hypothetical protein